MDKQQQQEEEVSITLDKLPPEIQEAPWKKLMKEIRQFDQLRKRWRLGFIHVSRRQYEVGVIQEIYGYYDHEFRGEKCEIFLGETFEEALERVDDERIGIPFGYDLA